MNRFTRLTAAVSTLILTVSGVSAAQPASQLAGPAATVAEPAPAICAVGDTAQQNIAASLTLPDFQAVVSPTDSQTRVVSYEKASLKIKPSAVKLPVGIGITALKDKDVPPLDSGMTNVTGKAHHGYRFTPHPMQFAEMIEVSLPYDPALLTEDFTAQDIYTYFYNEAGGCWEPLQRVRVDEANQLIVSLTDHFTTMVNATVVVPEHPEGVEFNPNQIKGIQAGDPGAGVNLIAPPSANNQGDNKLGYALELPPGRRGVQPQLSLSYDSSRGNGWLGGGWDLATPTVTVETRWGVPRYEAAQETETYVLNGEQLTPVAHRGVLQARTPEKVFHSRVEGSFAKIVRHGTSPANYTWEVTDKSGTTWIYGAADGSTLKDGKGNVFVWALQEVHDPNGNLMRYHYAKVNDTGLDSGSVPGSNLYLDRITYTGQNGVEGRYTVSFTRDRELGEPLRTDKMIDARGGFKRVTADLLRKVEVSLDGSLIRGYELSYVTGAFHKKLLRSISQLDANGALFNTHQFDYFDDIRDASGQYQAFQPLGWTSPGDGLSKDELNLTPSQAGDASALNANSSFGGGGHLYVGVGTQASKSGSVGLKVGFSHTDNDGVLALVDVDGDSLPDKVFRDGGATRYRKNLAKPGGQPRFSDEVRNLALPGISDESSNAVTLGIEGYLGAVAAQLDYVNTFATTSQYFSDVNGDGIMDLVTGSTVLFGRLGAGGVPVYGISGDTPVPVPSGPVDPTGLFSDFAADRDRLTDSFPLLDTLRRWVAPYTGVVSVTGNVKLADSTAAARAASTSADGVRVAIQLENLELWSEQIAAQDNSAHTPTGVASLAVTQGQRLYFRVQSVFDGALDEVSWDPVITYTGVSPVLDVNSLSGHQFQASRDFTLGGRSSSVKAPLTGTIHLSGDFVKSGPTTDDVTVVIAVDGVPALEQTLAAGSTGSVPVNFDRTVTQGQTLTWRVKVDSPIDLDRIDWVPNAFYTAASGVDRVTDPQGNPLITFYPPYNLDMYPQDGLAAPQGSHTVAADGDLTVAPELTFNFGGATPTARVAFTVKRRGALLGKRFFDIQGGVVTAPAPFTVAAQAGDELFFDFSTLDPALRGFLVSQSVLLDGNPVPSALHNALTEDAFAQPYRGWGAIGYNGNRGRAGTPINQADLVMDDDFGDQLPGSVDPQAQKDSFAADPRINPPSVDAFAPFPQFHRWGSSDHNWVTKSAASSSRRGALSIDLPDPVDFGGGYAVARLSRSQQISLTGGLSSPVGSIGGSIAEGASTGEVDFIDMNGDQFPDVVGANGIQFSDMVGGLGGKRGDLPGGAVRRSTNIAGNASAGSPARTITTGRGHGSPPGYTSTNTAEAGNDMPPLGIGGSIGGSSSDGNFDLLDINGDALPDRIYDNGDVALNLGYEFAGREPWRNPAALNDGDGESFGLNIGFNTDFYGFAGGASYSEGNNTANATLVDVNGDGLIDRVFAGSPLRVSLNTGNGFEPPVPFLGSLSAINDEQNARLGGGVYFTIPICFIFICIIINPGGDISTGASRTEFAIRDINGDGRPDHLSSTRDNQLTVAQNRTERTNLLRGVSRPMGARLDFDYTRDGNTYDQPQSRWLLTKTTVSDGFAGDGADTQLTTYEYTGGVFDRLEREFFGYGRVIERHRDTQAADAVYRSITRDYLTDSHYTRGLVRKELTTDAAGRPFAETEHTYALQEVGGGLANPRSTTATVFPQLTRTDKRFYEGNPTPGKATFTTMDYDAFGNVIRFFDASDVGSADDTDTRIRYSADDPACRTTNIVGVPNVIDVFGNGTLMRHRESTVDCATANVTQVRARLAGGETAVTDLEYFSNGNIRAVVNPPNRVSQRYRVDYTYDTAVATHVESITDSFGYRSLATYNLKFGLVENTTDFNNQVIRNTYDAVGRLDTVAGPYEAPENRLTIDFEYHPEATVPYAVTRHVDREANGTVRPDAIDTVIFIDGLGRKLQTKKDAAVHTGPNTAPQQAMIVSGRTVFDAFGRSTRQFYQTTEPKGGANQTFSPAFDSVSPTVRVFDVLDRTTRTTMPDATVTTTSFGFGPDRAGATQFETVITDASGNAKRTYADVRELTVALKESNPAGNQPVIWTSYTYDALAQLTAVTDDRNNVTRSGYDNFGRRTFTDSPDSGRTEIVYDLASNEIRKITSKLAAQNLAVEYDYQFNRLAGIRYPVFPANNVTYTYGAPNAANNGANRIVGVVDGAGVLSRKYGPLGETVEETRTTPAQGSHISTFTTSYRYDTWNRMLAMTYPDGEQLSYHYNSGGQIDSATGVKGEFTYNYLSRLDYDKFERRALLDTGNGTRTQYTYDAEDMRLANLRANAANGYVFDNLNYTYDEVGNVLQIHNNTVVPGGPDPGGPSLQTFRYDDLDRLVHAEGVYTSKNPRADTFRYDLSYDTIHNITRKTQVHEMVGNGNTQPVGKTSYDYAYSYASAKPHAPTTLGIYTIGYDANGNQISRDQQPRPRRQNIWDEENRLACSHENVQSQTLPQTPASCDNAGGTPNAARYYYDDQGTRIVKDSANFHMYPNRNFSTRGNQEFKHVYIGQTKLITKLVEPEHRIEDRQYYAHSDHLGSSGFVTDDRGNLAEHLKYFPGGETWVSEHPVQPVPQQFTGKEFDPETGLYYFGARYYDPRTQVWQSPDPELNQYMNGKLAGGVYTSANLALYTYAHNNSVRLTDPDGRWVHIAVGAGVGALISAGVEGYRQYKAGEFSALRLAGATAGGAVAGAVGAATLGASAGGAALGGSLLARTTVTVVGGSASGAAGGAAGGATEALITGGDVGQASLDGARSGAIAGAAGAVVAKAVGGIVTHYRLRPYAPGGGHHPVSQAAVRGAPGYPARGAGVLAVPNEVLNDLGVAHRVITQQQRDLYTAWRAANPTATPTWATIARIESQAMANAGMDPVLARTIVDRAIRELEARGIAAPTRIPYVDP
ncbi:hypothetical protein Rhe02_82540 [Rhizocola hellebori]|uniref:Sugar-binding protein n=1 Tax=Rhizocola hellebori TaxID=1392758 RepID=A0A8J3QHL1_9ACTN|nr:SpvB/TcaC N-terminal domain-containing protein [Rhizocola hellebori]GIH10187.1 hypothetical protein Rhe02_82540 [Rhizocola hellebori]